MAIHHLLFTAFSVDRFGGGVEAGHSLLIELCSASIYGSAFVRAKDFPAEEAARIYTYVALRTADRSQKSSFYAAASNLWQSAGQQGKALLYRALSRISAPSQGADPLESVLDDLRSAVAFLPLDTPERASVY